MRASKALRVAALGFAVVVAPAALSAQDVERAHALSLLGAPKFGPDFKNFDWVNPNAPKGGTVRQHNEGSFDTLNAFSRKGDQGLETALVHATLMTSSPDEASTEYGYIAEWVSHPADFSSVTYSLRASAKFQDGRPITPDDVIFTLNELKRVSPNYAFYFKNVVKAEKIADREIKFTFDMRDNRELPQIIGQMPVLPKHWWEGKNEQGQLRNLDDSSLEIPLGSGPYRVKSMQAGRSIVYERIKDWWGTDLPSMKGQYNFDEISADFYRERTAAFEAFKSGQLDMWRETSAKDWATAYDFDAVKKGLIKQLKLPVTRVAPMQAFVMNTRRPQFQDPRVRRALNHAFNFEQANKTLFYEQYIRVGSYFDNSELAATGLPTGQELAILKEFEKDLPPEVFTTEWKNPINVKPEDARANLSLASKLFSEAGYTAKNGVLTNAKGQTLTAEILLVSPTFERVAVPYRDILQKLGFQVTVRLVDSAQYTRRVTGFDFDIIVGGFAQSESPGNEQREFWGSDSAAREGSRNVIGIKNPVVDKLIERIVVAKDRNDLIAATRALDRVLLWNHYVVPMWHLPFDRIAMWDKFGRPEKLPSRDTAFRRVWWYDAAKAKVIDAAGASR